MKWSTFMTCAVHLLVELSGEHPALAHAEARAALEASQVGHRFLLAEERLLAVETDADASRLGRSLGLAHFVDELLAWGELEEVLAAARALDFADRTFRVRVNSFKGCHTKLELERRVGDLVAGPVDLVAPREEVRLIEGEQHYLCRRLATIDRHAFETRKVAQRPFVQPISLHPRFARALVNLARVRDGQTVLDPFCGTGGVLLEAGLLGARVIGSDIRADMVEGCRTTLGEFGLAATLFASDVGAVQDRVGQVDAVATDPPYGRATSTKGESIGSLYGRTVLAARRVLAPGGYMAMIVPDPVLIAPVDGLHFVETYALRVHKSLTRYFIVMRRAYRS